MSPRDVKLTTSQKIMPLIKAINAEIPWQVIFIFTIGFSVWLIGPTFISQFIQENLWDFMVRRVFIGFIMGLVSAFITAWVIFIYEEKIKPSIEKIKENYEVEALKVKRQVLDNVIDDEILRKLTDGKTCFI